MSVNTDLKAKQFQALEVERQAPTVQHSVEDRLNKLTKRFDAMDGVLKSTQARVGKLAAAADEKPAAEEEKKADKKAEKPAEKPAAEAKPKKAEEAPAAEVKAEKKADKKDKKGGAPAPVIVLDVPADAKKIEIENVEVALTELFDEAIAAAFPAVEAKPAALITIGKATEYQCNNAMGLVKVLSQQKPPVKMGPKEVGVKLVESLPKNDLIESVQPTDQGFINIAIRPQWAASSVARVIKSGVKAPALEKQNILVDFSSPNIAKEMHVGHLRSTIIGDSICRLFEFLGHDVRRINHVGDWGTQFGMLILYMKEQFPNFLESPPAIKDLVVFYKAAKKKFDDDATFKENARLEVVKLQALDETSIKAWQMICDLSRAEFDQIYSRLDIKLEERGESYYNPMIPDVLKTLEEAGQIETSDGASIIVSKEAKNVKEIDAKVMSRLISSYLIQVKRDCSKTVSEALLEGMKRLKVLTTNEAGEEVFALTKKETKPWAKFDMQMDTDKLAKAVEGLYKPALDAGIAAELEKMGVMSGETVQVPRYAFPLIAKKSDGGFTYDTTDLAAMHHRYCQEKYKRVVYVTDVGQFEHFKMVAQVAQDMGWMDGASWDHAGFGLVSGEDGKKLKTRSGDTVKLKDLLDEACDRAYATMKEREGEADRAQGHTDEEMRAMSRKIGFGAVKYFDLKQNRTSDYKFSYDKMLDASGNTAVYLLYSYARLCSIKRKAGVTDEEITSLEEVVLTHEKEKQLALCAFRFGSVLLKTSQDLMLNHLTDFAYELVGKFSDFFRDCRVVGHEQQASRLALVEVTRATLKETLSLLGIEATEKM